MNEEQKEAAINYVNDRYCIPSDDNIETDSETNNEDFSECEAGVWVRGWLWCPAEEIPGCPGEGA